MAGNELMRYTENDSPPHTKRQERRIAYLLKKHLSVVDDRIDCAEALGLIPYVGHDNMVTSGKVKPRAVLREPRIEEATNGQENAEDRPCARQEHQAAHQPG